MTAPTIDAVTVTYPDGKTSLAVRESATVDVVARNVDELRGVGTYTNVRTGVTAPFTVTILTGGDPTQLSYEMTVDVGSVDPPDEVTVGRFVYTRTV